MNEKLLWKIESLWGQYYHPRSSQLIDVDGHYKEGISVYYPRFHMVDQFSFVPSQEVVFTDDYGSYYGLKDFQLTLKDNKLVYLFDNHNEMIYPLVELGTGLTVVHIDAHRDDAVFEGEKRTTLSLGEVGEYIKETRISDFFDALSKTGIVQKIYQVTHSDSFEFFTVPEEPYILSLDIDIFGKEGEFVELEEKVRVIAGAWGNADAVCIATSPGFIDQEYAQKIINIFMNSSKL